MKTHCWLVINPRGVKKLTKAKPTLAPNEIAVCVTLTVDNACFNVDPQASINITPADVERPNPTIEVCSSAVE